MLLVYFFRARDFFPSFFFQRFAHLFRARPIDCTLRFWKGIRHLFMWSVCNALGSFRYGEFVFFCCRESCAYFFFSPFSGSQETGYVLSSLSSCAETITANDLPFDIGCSLCVVLFARADSWSFSFENFSMKIKKWKIAGKFEVNRHFLQASVALSIRWQFPAIRIWRTAALFGWWKKISEQRYSSVNFQWADTRFGDIAIN